MKLTYDQILNLVLLSIIFVLLFRMSDQYFFKKLYNFCVYTINNINYKDYKFELYSETKSDGESHLNSYDLLNNNKLVNKNEQKEVKKSSASVYYSENLEDKIAEQIYDFFQTLINVENDTFVKSSKKIKLSNNHTDILINFIKTKINTNSNFKFNNLQILNNIIYVADDKMVEIQPLHILMNYNSLISVKLKGQIIIQLELNFKFNNSDDIFITQTKFINKNGIFEISRISILEFNKTIQPNNIPLQLSESFTKSEVLSWNRSVPTETTFVEDELIINNIDISDSFVFDDFVMKNEVLTNSKNKDNKLQTFQVDTYSETNMSIIPDRILITDNQ